MDPSRVGRWERSRLTRGWIGPAPGRVVGEEPALRGRVGPCAGSGWGEAEADPRGVGLGPGRAVGEEPDLGSGLDPAPGRAGRRGPALRGAGWVLSRGGAGWKRIPDLCSGRA